MSGAARAGHFTYIIIAGQSRVGKPQHANVFLCRIRLLAQALAELHGAVRAGSNAFSKRNASSKSPDCKSTSSFPVFSGRRSKSAFKK